MSNYDHLKPSTVMGIKRFADRIQAQSGDSRSEALDEASKRAGFQNYQHARRTLRDVQRTPSSATPENAATGRSDLAIETDLDAELDALFEHLKLTPDQERFKDLNNRFLELQERREKQHHDRAERYHRRDGHLSSEWNYGQPSQAMHIAYEETIDEDALQVEDEIDDAFRALRPAYEVRAPIPVADLDQLEDDLRGYASNLGVDFDGLFD